MAKVVVLGGGVAGLSAAQELVERGFTVEVYEKGPSFGGKARSINAVGTGTGPRKDLPGEHGFRFFPGFYSHVTDTMSRIPIGGGKHVFPDNFEEAKRIAVCQTSSPPWLFLSSVPMPSNTLGWLQALVSLLTADNLGLSTQDAVFFAKRILLFLMTGHKRREGEYEQTPWYEFIGATRSAQYEKILARSLTLMLVAMKAEDASTRTVGTILVQLLIDILDPTRQSDRILNAPTNDAWIDPWITHLSGQGVTLTPDAEVKGFVLNGPGDALTGINVEISGVPQVVTGDYYVVALPVEVAQTVMDVNLKAKAGLTGIDALQTAWMNGVVFYMDKDVKLTDGHTIYADSSWAITSISQPQFWKDVDLADYGDGTVKGILSTVVSDWFENGQHVVPTKPAKNCSKDEVINEVWEQVKAHHAQSTKAEDHLDTVNRIHTFVDPAITFAAVPGDENTNSEPLLINTTDSLKDRPLAVTAITNMVLASDYVVTNTDLATMEGANEAARRAVNAILTKEGQPADCVIHPLEEPQLFDLFKQADDLAFDNGLPNPWEALVNEHAETILSDTLNTLGVPSSIPPISGATPGLVLSVILNAILILILVAQYL